jgi:aminomethyltransferase
MSVTTLAELGVTKYDDPLEEARRCRQDGALFDFSFMSRARISGPDALGYLNTFQSRDLSTMRAGDIRYGLCADADGSVSSDLTVWRYSGDTFEVYSGRPEDIDLIAAGLPDRCDFRDLSDSTSIFSVQGPSSLDLLSRFGDREALRALSYFRHRRIAIGGVPCQVGRLGYTGEKGFEIVVDSRPGSDSVWDMLLDGVRPAGVAAMDILRIEAGFILFLNECRMGCNAAELGLGGFSSTGATQVRHQLVCFRADERSIEMPWSPPPDLPGPGEAEIVVTSASLSVLCEGVLGLGFVRHADRDVTILRDPSGRFHGIRRARLPFYDPSKKVPRSDW